MHAQSNIHADPEWCQASLKQLSANENGGLSFILSQDHEYKTIVSFCKTKWQMKNVCLVCQGAVPIM